MKIDKQADFENESLGFCEIDQGFGIREAIEEAKRCLNCKNPLCRKGCPIENDIPQFIQALAHGNIGEAGVIISKRSNLPAVCGRVCPHEQQCEGSCILNAKKEPIKIGKLERFIADFEAEMGVTIERPPYKDGDIAVIGAGPAGLTVAGDLAKMGFSVTVFESQSEPGGVLMYGIPGFRLNREVVRREIRKIEQLGVKFRTNTLVGQDITIDEMLEKEFDAVFIGTGTALPKTLNVPGKELTGVIQAMYLLRMVTLANHGDVSDKEIPIDQGDRVIVIGAGNVAIDAARTALRLGATSVTIVYRRTIEEMPALRSEYEHAVKEGVQFSWLSSPVAFLGEENVQQLQYEVQEVDENGKIRGTGNMEIIPADKIILAIGQRPAARVISTAKGIEVNEEGYVITKEYPYGMTTRKGVFAGGDVVHEPATVVLAMKEAKKVAAGIAKYVEAKKLIEALDKNI
ncbi:pyridine nucleotide-disulfide oxidoreductase [Desulfuribacillus stibiiarsenatis]|uniref:Pyridine nucleotide-disulfide oxidoreductase n=1 Tax=Desulfuribacillus stibiiarsenatis TaxID=1390249 RepID=A0A1E5L5Q4_9FIRM|nr:NAD(P)-dependent oxidoreductase [Desulfuribacillus stibiiarsenatis]OEH85309.1 pyridine nucleotide-disulfide oxidoreductase [Desulfuribacillus stibiiarsenatis]